MKKILLSTMMLSMLSAMALADDDKLPHNPTPFDDDVTIPLPCGLDMAFRKVYTLAPDKKKMDDLKISMGINNKDDNPSLYAQDRVDAHIQGGFLDKKGYYYLMGKYEVTQAQYDALMSQGKCPESLKDPTKIKKKQLFPVVKISWFDAVNAAKNLTLFLQQQDKKEGYDEFTYARIPTDAEWEFAASGGLKATSSQRDDKKSPLLWGGKTPESTNDFAFFNSSQSANGKLKLIGLKQANALGIFDMLGNAAEMIFEPFHATKYSRYHGQSGGFVVRGGSYRSVEGDISTANRVEKAYFLKGKELSTDDIGMRLVLNRIVATTPEDFKEIKKELLSYGTKEETGKADGQKDDTYKKLLELEKSKFASESKELQKQLNDIKNSMTKANAERDEMIDTAVVSNMKLGAFLCKGLTDEQSTYNFFDAMAKTYEKRCKDAPDNDSICGRAKKMREYAESMQRQRDVIVNYYADNLADTTHTYDLKLFENNLKSARMALDNDSLEAFLDVYHKPLTSYKNQSKDLKKNKEKWIEDCRKVVTSKNK